VSTHVTETPYHSKRHAEVTEQSEGTEILKHTPTDEEHMRGLCKSGLSQILLLLAPTIILVHHLPAVAQETATASPDNNAPQDVPVSPSEEDASQPEQGRPGNTERIDDGRALPEEGEPTQIEPDENAEPEPTDDAHVPPGQGEPGQTTEPPAIPALEETAIPPWLHMFKLKADLRYRFEIIERDDADLRYRHRIRVRVGIMASIYESLDAFIGLGTGQNSDPKSNNQSLTESFSSKPLWLDLAFVDWHPSFAEGFYFMGGKIKNPFYRVGKSELQWDPDLNPEGLSLNFRRAFGMVEPFIHTGAFFVEERGNDDDTWLLGVQAGVKLIFAEGLFYLLAGAGYMDYLHLRGKALLWDEEDSFGNSTDTVVDEDGNNVLVYASDYNEVNAFAEIGGKIARFPWAVFADFGLNTATDIHNMGWLVGASFGRCKESLDFALRYIYRDVESDAVFGLHTDSDFAGGATGARGHEVNFSLQIVQYVQFAATYFYSEFALDPSQPYHRAQMDFKFAF
jgi:hypothetical protein